MSGDQLDLDAVEARRQTAAMSHADAADRQDFLRTDAVALVAEVRRLREALETIAGDDLDYLGRLRLTDTENAIYVIARDALGRKV